MTDNEVKDADVVVRLRTMIASRADTFKDILNDCLAEITKLRAQLAEIEAEDAKMQEMFREVEENYDDLEDDDDDREPPNIAPPPPGVHRRTPAEHLEMARKRAARLRAPTAPLSVIRRYWNLALRRTRRS